MKTLIQADWVPTQQEFDAFARVSGDDNPIHVDPDFSSRTRFGRTVSHGMLIYTKLWAMVRQVRPELPHRLQTLMFPNPAFAGEPVTLAVQETPEGHLAVSATRKADGMILLQGTTEGA
ncbi:MaoC/PaaZ C-terminal domain-containing protein [Pararhodobacter sp. SW119]|uniref:MaoC family dehydratase n=1 Tax=Pararhodobacter sp. SW119 TaxID=2780075 RepID=UPI001ADEDC33|nr:MaoC/PaaZ C-terminal domain-containing protein [Pararhodobacter sp. SW119]